MPTDYFGDGDEAMPPAADQPATDAKEGGEDREESTVQSSLLPKAMFAGKTFAPGDTITLKVVAVHEGEFEVEQADASEEPESESTEPDPEPAMPDGEVPMGGGMGRYME